VDVAGLSLQGALASADRDIRRIAAAADKDPKDAKAKLEPYLNAEKFKALSSSSKEHITLLEGVVALRNGDFETADKAFRKSSRAADRNIASYAQACQAVLKRFSREFDGKPLSDRVVFARAGLELAQEHIRSAREFLKDRLRTDKPTKADYRQIVGNVKRFEEPIQVAAVLAGPEADDELIRLWNFAKDSCVNEYFRLEDEIKEKEGKGGGSRSSPRDIQELQMERQKVVETHNEYAGKLFDYGFRIEDPDIYEQREGRWQPTSDDGP
jgi:hypothetical protein